MSGPILHIGGTRSIMCPRCGRLPWASCVTPSGRPARMPHAERVEAAPPEQDARVGDLVIVRAAGMLTRIAAIDEIHLLFVIARIWEWRWSSFGAAVTLDVERVLRLAPDDATTAAARAALAGAP